MVSRMVQQAAILPPQLRFSGLMKIVSKAVQTFKLSGPLTTNFGLCSSFRITYPGHDNRVLLFGRPEDYVSERGALFTMQKLLPLAHAFIDVGAHLGYYSYFAKLRCAFNKPIYFVEPHPELFKLFEKTVRENRFEGMQGIQCALGNKEGLLPFFIDDVDCSRSTLLPAENQSALQKIDVAVRTLDSLVRQLNVPDKLFVKVDIENGEWEFLEGARLTLPKIDFLVMEVLLPAQRRGIINHLREEGTFEAYYINDDVLVHSIDGRFDFRSSQYNWLFCRLKPDELRRRGLRVR